MSAGNQGLLEVLLAEIQKDSPSIPEPQSSDLEAALEELVDRVQAAFPDRQIPIEDFVRFIAKRIDLDTSLIDSLKNAAVEDLSLTFLCLQNQTVALEQLQKHLNGIGAKIFKAFALTKPEREDLLQTFLAELLVEKESSPPLLSQYRGQGQLDNWLRIVFLRMVTRYKRKIRKTVSLEDTAINHLGIDAYNPEIGYLKDHYLVEFKKAFREAIRILPSRDRNILRYYLFDGLNIEQIGDIYQVHRATVARWIGKIRESLLRETSRRMKKQLNIEKTDLESVMKFIGSRLDMTLSKILSGE